MSIQGGQPERSRKQSIIIIVVILAVWLAMLLLVIPAEAQQRTTRYQRTPVATQRTTRYQRTPVAQQTRSAIRQDISRAPRSPNEPVLRQAPLVGDIGRAAGVYTDGTPVPANSGNRAGRSGR